MEQQYEQGDETDAMKRTRRGGKKRRGGVAHRVIFAIFRCISC
jgi:hypothetical protein